ncbi:MAG TPA: molybdenum cofactor guanylyltransferase [Anaerolineae bacterium]|nr:molybdenum cofactor guanylyltransferase [Anaerolineae bacterium]
MLRDAGPEPKPAISGVILAGGQSERLGRDKSLLEVAGEPLLARAVRLLAVLSDDLIVVTNDPTRYTRLDLVARLVSDERPGFGSLMGMYSGLKAANHQRALVVACDMPFINLPLLRYMLSLAEGHDVVVPRVDGLLEPLHAIYDKSCLPYIREVLDGGQRKIIAFFDRVCVRYVEEQEIGEFDPLRLSFLNVNTPEDWMRTQELLAQHSQ